MIHLTVFAGMSLLCVTGCGPNSPQKVAVPAYFYAGPQWTQLEDARVGFAVMNPDSGPGSGPSSQQYNDYKAQVSTSQSKGILILGYVHTDYGKRAIADVKAEVNKYFKWYGVDGIFFDEASTDASTVGPYYEPLFSHVKAKEAKSLVVLNPGRQTDEAFMKVCDIVVNFEGPYERTEDLPEANSYNDYDALAWTRDYERSKFCHFVYNATQKQMTKAIVLSKERRAGWVFVTDDLWSTYQNGKPVLNPWDELPSSNYWLEELFNASN